MVPFDESDMSLLLAVLPEGFGLPPLPYVGVLAGGLLAVAALLWEIKPPVTESTALALAPWMATGGVMHAFHQIGVYPDWLAPLFGAPAVYATTAVIAGLIWIGAAFYGAMVEGSTDRALGLVGVAVLVTFGAQGVYGAYLGGILAPTWPTVSLVVATLVTAVVWILISLFATGSAAAASWTGASSRSASSSTAIPSVRANRIGSSRRLP